MPGIRIENADSTKTIAGYLCKCSNVFIGDSAKPSFSIYYTEEIKLDNPNCNNPFNMINGVLLEFQMSFQKIPMRLTAKKVIKEEIPEDEFKVPEGFSKVPMAKMQEVISNLM